MSGARPGHTAEPPIAPLKAHPRIAPARLCEPQRVSSSVTRKLVPTPALPATRCGSQTRAAPKTGGVRGLYQEAPFTQGQAG